MRNNDIRITHARVTPIAFRDGPLLNASGIHEPWALRSIIELETSTAGWASPKPMATRRCWSPCWSRRAPWPWAFRPFDLNVMEQRVRASIKPGQGGGVQFELAPGSHTAKNAEKVISALEVAMLDLQGQLLNLPICDLLGGAVRDAVPYSAYLFYKYAEHAEKPYAPDAWGEAVTPAQLVKQAQAHGGPVRLQKHQAQGRRVHARRGNRRHQGLAQGFSHAPAAAGPERQLVAADQH